MSETYAEAAVLVAIMDGDEDAADERLDEFHPHELKIFESQAYLLVDRIRRARKRKEATR